MRRLSALIMVFVLSACATSNESPVVEAPPVEPVIAEAPPPAPPPPPPPPPPPLPPPPAPAEETPTSPTRSLTVPPPAPDPVEVRAMETPARSASECERIAAEGARRGDEWISCVSVFYGTNRTAVEGDTTAISSKTIGNGRATDKGDLFDIRPEPRANCEPSPFDYSQTASSTRVCHLGEVVISIPDSRREKLAKGGGSFKAVRSGARLRDRDLKKYFALLDHWSYDRDPEGFADRIHQVIAASDPDSEHAFVFIHGFNVPFRNAAFRTAQLKYDMEIDGPAFFFSWPSNGNLLDYLNDQEDADLSVDALARFLRFTHETVSSSDRPMKLHIVAHSMGTRVTAQALARLSDFSREKKFGHVIFAAGDLDSNLFAEWMGAAAPIYDGVTIYTSQSDAAVGFSGALRNLSSKMNFFGSNGNADIKSRIGFYKGGGPAVFDMPDDLGRQFVKTIDVTKAASKSFFFKVKHTTYAQSTSITNDIRCLFDHPYSMPDERSGQFKRLTTGHPHWVLEPRSVMDPSFASVQSVCD